MRKIEPKDAARRSLLMSHPDAARIMEAGIRYGWASRTWREQFGKNLDPVKVQELVREITEAYELSGFPRYGKKGRT